MNETPFYSGYLYTALASTAHMNSGQVTAIMDKFNKLAPHGAEMAFSVVMEAYGNEDTRAAVQTVKSIIHSALEAENARHPGVDRCGISRVKKAAETLNKNLDKCSVEIDGVPMSRDEVEKIKVKVPACFKSQTYTATARTGKQRRFEMDVKFLK